MKKVNEDDNVSAFEAILRIAIYLITIPIIIICMVIIIRALIRPNEIPPIFGYRPVIILDTYDTRIESGDLVFVNKDVSEITVDNVADVFSFKISGLGNVMMFMAQPITLIVELAIVFIAGAIAIKISDYYDEHHAKA